MKTLYLDIDDTLNETSEVINFIYERTTGEEVPETYNDKKNDPLYMKIIEGGSFLPVVRPILPMTNVIYHYHMKGYKINLITHRGYNELSGLNDIFIGDYFEYYIHKNIEDVEVLYLNPHNEEESNKLEYIYSIRNSYKDWVLVDDNPCYFTFPDMERWKYNILWFKNRIDLEPEKYIDLEKYIDNIFAYHSDYNYEGDMDDIVIDKINNIFDSQCKI